MAVQLSALRSELLSDPASMGYGTYLSTGTYSIIAYLLNSVSANSHTAGSAVSVSRVGSLDLQVAVVASEYLALSGGQQALWNAALIAAVNGIAISNTTFRQQVTTVWSAGTTTRANLLLLQTRRCSRAEALFGERASVDVNAVVKAAEGDF